MAVTVTELAATTLRNRTKNLADNISKSNILLAKLKSKGKVRPHDGGTEIWQSIVYAENETVSRYDGYDRFRFRRRRYFAKSPFRHHACLLYTSPSPRD